MSHRKFATPLIKWYRDNKRDLPWRRTTDPYKVLLSEIILQQTRVEQGLPYYLSFLNSFATVHELAAASEDQVLRLWQGLGYYSRARYLHTCAKQISEELEGQFPNTYSELVKLPGIGPYTAAAIASFCFQEAVPVVDGNVFRVLSRFLGIDKNIADQRTRSIFSEAALELMDGSAPDDFNQAIMEFGALHCVPKNPDCHQCIFCDSCYANEKGAQHLLPVKEKKILIKERWFHYIVLEDQESLFLKKRQAGDVWQGLYDFYLIERSAAMKPEEVLEALTKNNIGQYALTAVSKPYKHVLTHQRIFARFFRIHINGPNFAKDLITKHNLTGFAKQEVDKIPKPRLVDRFLSEENFYLT